MKGIETIMKKSKDMEFDREYRIRELIRVVPHSMVATVKSEDIEGEPTGRYSVFFKNLNEADGLQESINDGKTVLVTLKEIGGRPGVIKSHILAKDTVEFKEPSLKEQKKENKAFADY